MSIYRSINPHVDWVSATARENSKGEMALYRVARNIADELGEQYGFLTDTWMFYGYTGFTIRGEGHVSYGEREGQGALLQAGGAVSARVWAEVVGVADNVTRFDICVDVELLEADPSIARICWDYLDRGDKMSKGRKCSLIQSRTGDTLYIGSRKSPAFGRIYDKSSESGMGEKGSMWRYELELKGDKARQVANTLLEAYHDPRRESDTVGKLIVSTVYRWFVDRMVEPLFEPDGRGISYMSARTSTTMNQKIEWLKVQVRPTVLKLMAAGYSQEVIEALGLADISYK